MADPNIHRSSRGLILTGTRGAGKSTIAKRLVEMGDGYRLVQAITTRGPRRGDDDGSYDHVSEDDYHILIKDDALLVRASYGPYMYGILRSAVNDIVAEGLTPILVITPQSALNIATGPGGTEWVAIFLDSPDGILDTRLERDGRPATPADLEQRVKDRTFAVAPVRTVDNDDDLKLAVAKVKDAHLRATA